MEEGSRRGRRRERGQASASAAVSLFLVSSVVSYFAMDRIDGRPVEGAVLPAPAAVAAAAPAIAADSKDASPGRKTESAAPSESAAQIEGVIRVVDRGEPPWHGPTQPESAGASPTEHGPGGEIAVLTGRIPVGGTLAQALAGENVSPRVVHQISQSIRPVFDFRYARPGDFFSLIQDASEELLSFEFQRGRQMIYRVARGPDGRLNAEASEVPLERRVVHVGGVIDRSLFDSVIALGEDADLVHEFADIFVWDVDFSTQTRPGDEFRLVFEKYYDPAGFVRYGKILAASYATVDRTYTSIYFEDDEGYGDYFATDGTSVRRSFLRAPLKYSRISSRYSRSRMHPILKIRRPHLGIDYAAPAGTPVWAIADGTVIARGWSGGFGRLIKVRHKNGYVSYYGHLQRYASAIRVGDQIRQKQVIGYVGSSGMSTGPHLDFRLKNGSKFVDPLRVKFPKGEPVPVKSFEAFESQRDQLMAQLELAAPALILEARQDVLAE